MKKPATFQLNSRSIGAKHKPFLIAEVAQAHDGSLGMAHAYIDAAAEIGVDAVKFQTHIASSESSREEQFRIEFSWQDATRYQYWKRMEFSPEQWDGLARHARDKKLEFLSSPFSVEAVALLEKIDVPAWKIGSGEAVSGDILDAVMRTGRPILLSTGMSSLEEIGDIVSRFSERNIPFACLQCTSAYPTTFSEVGLNVIAEIRNRFLCPTGLSDHSGTVFPGLAAMAQGADLFEAHIVFDKRMFGPDTSASLTADEFKLIVRARDAFFEMLSFPVNKGEMAEKMRSMRSTFGKSIAPHFDLKAGVELTESMLSLKKPGSGIPPSELPRVVGRKLKHDVPMDRLLRWEDLSE